MSDWVKPEETEAKSILRTLAGMMIGVPVGAVVFGALGTFCCFLIGLLLHAFVEGFVPRSEESPLGFLFMGALKWGFFLFGSIGVILGPIVGGMAGWKGRPLWRGTIRECWVAFGCIVTVGKFYAAATTGGIAGDAAGDAVMQLGRKKKSAKNRT